MPSENEITVGQALGMALLDRLFDTRREVSGEALFEIRLARDGPNGVVFPVHGKLRPACGGGRIAFRDGGLKLWPPSSEGNVRLHRLRAGGSYAPPASLLADEPSPQEARGLLTSRQSEVLRELRQGKPNKIIAYELGMSESTVKVHIRNIMRKVGATNRTQVVYKAHKLRGAAAAPLPAVA